MAELLPTKEATLAALDRLLAYPELARSPQLARFLDYIVKRTLNGDEQGIKAYSIAVDVFGREAGFDPQVDPIVRVQARRLRKVLADYNSGVGINDPVRIDLPVGRYVPEFSQHGIAAIQSELPPSAETDIATSVPAPGRLLFLGALTALVLVTAGLAVLVWMPRQQGRALFADTLDFPRIGVVEFQRVGEEHLAIPVSGLAVELVSDLSQFDDLMPTYLSSSQTPPDVLANDYVLNGIARRSGTEAQYSAILTDARTGSVVWDYTLKAPVDETDLESVIDEVSLRLSLVLGSPRGPLHVQARRFVETENNPVPVASLYGCRILFDLYRESATETDAEKAQSCFSALGQADRNVAWVIAASASLLAEAGGSALENNADRNARLDDAGQAMTRAVGQDPASAFAWEQRGRLHALMQEWDAARSDLASSVQLNPASGDAVAAFALLLTLTGRVEQAKPLTLRAVDQTPSPPHWYHGAAAVLSLQSGDFHQALDHATAYAQADPELGPILAIMAARRLGDVTTVNRYLAQVLDGSGFRPVGILPRLRERIADEALLYRIRVALTEAGVPPQAMIRPF